MSVSIQRKQNRRSDLNNTLADVESHLPRGHQYKDRDKITWTHEGTHGVNHLTRIEYAQGDQYAIYCLNGFAEILDRPPIQLRDVSKTIPTSLRGDVYQLYFVSQAREWNDRPLYVYDEFSCYLHGSMTRLELGIESRQETVKYMLEFIGYSLALIEAARYPEHLREFAKWIVQEAVAVYDSSQNLTSAITTREKMVKDSYWDRFEDYCGAAWVEQYLRNATVDDLICKTKPA